MGTGTGDMIRRCREAGLREPTFEMADGFTLTLWRARETSAGARTSGEMSGEMSGEKLPGMQSKLVRLMRKQPNITIPEMARRMKRTERTVERQITLLKAAEIIGRIGPTKGGHWEVLR